MISGLQAVTWDLKIYVYLMATQFYYLCLSLIMKHFILTFCYSREYTVACSSNSTDIYLAYPLYATSAAITWYVLHKATMTRWGKRHSSTDLYFYRTSKKSLHKPRVTFENLLFHISCVFNFYLQLLCLQFLQYLKLT